MHHTFMCVYMHACAYVRMHGCILCVHTNVDVSIYHLQVYEFMYPFKSVICRSCICVQFILIHSVCFVLSLTLNMLVTLRSLVIDAIKNILNLNLNLNTFQVNITKIEIVIFFQGKVFELVVEHRKRDFLKLQCDDFKQPIMIFKTVILQVKWH